MKQAGATQVGVGPRAIAGTLSSVDVIVSSLNLVLPGAMLGEVTPEIRSRHPRRTGHEGPAAAQSGSRGDCGRGAYTLEALITQSLSRVRFLVSSVRPA